MTNDGAALAAEFEQASGGRIAFACHNLSTGARLGYRADEQVPTASVIKLPILVHLALAAADGEIDWEEQLALSDGVKVPGTGVLKELSAGLPITVRDLAVLMTALSDNTATNMLIDRVGIAAVNERLASLGLPHTRLLRRAYTPDTPASRPFGLGVTTADEQVALLARLTRGELDAGAAAVVLEMLAMQQDRAAIGRWLPEGWHYAGKTGSITHLRSDVGLLTGPAGQQLAIAVFCTDIPQVDWSVDNPGLRAIAGLARRVVDDMGSVASLSC
jgi:beta-lactamase class A